MADNAAAKVDNVVQLKPNSNEVARRASIHTVGPLLPYDRLDIQTSAQTRKYSAIAKNPVVKTALDINMSQVWGSEASFKPKNDYELFPQFKKIDDEIIKYFHHLCELSYCTFQSALEGFLRKAWVYGWSLSLKVLTFENDFWKLQSLKGRPVYLFEPYIDDKGNLQSLMYYEHKGDVPGEPDAFIDPRYFIIGTWPYLNDDNYYGESLLDCIEHDVKILETLEEYRTKGMTQALLKPLVHYYDAIGRSKEEIQKSNDAIKSADGASVIQLPASFTTEADGKQYLAFYDKIEVLDDRSSQYAPLETRDIIKQYENRIMLALGVPNELGTPTDTGSYAKAKETFKLLNRTAEKGRRFLEDNINRQLVIPLIQANWQSLPPDYKMPYWCFDESEDDVKIQNAEYAKMLVEAGIADPNEPWLRKELNLPPRDMVNFPINVTVSAPGMPTGVYNA